MIDVFIGTRPEVVKLCPVVKALRKKTEVRVIVTGQHDDLTQHFKAFGLKPDFGLDAPPKDLSLASRTAWFMNLCSEFYSLSGKPSCAVVQGDTATVFAAAMASFMNEVPVVHVEAGLRTFDIASPFPEEGYRQMVSRIAAVNFAPTTAAVDNLHNEQIRDNKIELVGNTVVDGLHMAKENAMWPDGALKPKPGSPFILVTCHRRENWGHHAERLARFLNHSVFANTAGMVVLHPNPVAAKPFQELNDRFARIDSVAYNEMVAMLMRANLVITDSGGLVEEASCLGIPVAIFRDTSERLEAVNAGVARMSFDEASLERNVGDALSGKWKALATDTFGDGNAAEKIADSLERRGLL